jgi:hypothetical protein
VDGALADIVSGPRAVAFTPDGGLALMVNMSSEDVTVLDASRRIQAELVRPLPGDLPEGIVVSPDGRFAYVDQRASSDIAVLTIAADWATRSSGRVSVDGPALPRLATPDPMPAQQRLGQRLFYSANSAEFPMTKNFWVACASCHLEGRSDAVTWLFKQGPRDTPSNAGGTLGTGFLLRTAGRNLLAQYDETIRVEQGGTLDLTRPADRKLLDALTAYVDHAIPLPKSPEVDARTGSPLCRRRTWPSGVYAPGLQHLPQRPQADRQRRWQPDPGSDRPARPRDPARRRQLRHRHLPRQGDPGLRRQRAHRVRL